ncbi:MAG: hypothetical protein Q9218_001913 [Villophora microphyllina]
MTERKLGQKEQAKILTYLIPTTYPIPMLLAPIFLAFQASLVHLSTATPLTLPLQNASSLLTTISNTALTAPHRYPVGCYVQRKPPHPQRHKALELDCFVLAHRLVRRLPYPDRQERWSHDPSRGLKVPKFFYEKTCVFEVDLPPEAQGGWMASFSDIAFGSNEIVHPCVWGEEHLGGTTKIGPKGKIDLKVYGREWEPPEPPEEISVVKRRLEESEKVDDES